MHKFDLVGDGIENPHNARAMIGAATMFGADCSLLDRKGIATQVECSVATLEQVVSEHDMIIALDNQPGAKSVYGYRVPAESRNVAVIAGNERLGVSHSIVSSAHAMLCIPMVSRKVNCLNVASASAVVLYYLSNRFAAAMATRSQPQKRRPEILMIAGRDHVELGSSIRSACAFGWNRVFVEDRRNIWFGADHGLKREARAAARRAKNEIRVIPTSQHHQYKFQEAVIVACGKHQDRKGVHGAVPLHKARLAEGPSQLIVLVDQSAFDISMIGDFSRFANKVQIAYLECGGSAHEHQFRLTASIAMAEIARQVGQKTPWKPTPQEPLYESALRSIADEQGEIFTLEDLQQF
jgi:hypothetical protein